MELDFSRLQQIKRDEVFIPNKTEDPLAISQLQVKTDQNNQAKQRALTVYKTYLENKKQTEELIAGIVKGIQQGEDISALFLMAVQAIGNMVGEDALYNRISEEFKDIYGIGLKKETPLSFVLSDAKSRLESLEMALEESLNTDTYKRIERAVKTHKIMIEKYERALS